MPLVLLERSWWAGFFSGIYLIRFGFKMWEILILKWFLLLRIQIIFLKTRFWKEKSVEDMVTLGSTAQATLVILNSQKLFHLHSSNWMPSQQNQTWSSTHSVMPWMLIYERIIWSLVHILCSVVCKTEHIFVYPLKFAIVRRHQWHM